MSKIKDLVRWLRTKVVQYFAYEPPVCDSDEAIGQRVLRGRGRPDANHTFRVNFVGPPHVPPAHLGAWREADGISVDFTTNTTGEKMSDPKPVVVYQLDEDMIKGLEKLLPQPIVTGQATEATLAAQVAYAHVLRILRDGIAVKR